MVPVIIWLWGMIFFEKLLVRRMLRNELAKMD
jgi:hypothetical protein